MDEGRSMGGEIDGLLDGLTRLLTQGVNAAAPVRVPRAARLPLPTAVAFASLARSLPPCAGARAVRLALAGTPLAPSPP